MKIGLIRCMQTEDICPSTSCFRVISGRKLAFEGITEEITIIGWNSCGGCPGKNAVSRAAEMVKRGADTIVLASCITRGAPIGFPCPFADQIKEAVVRKVGESVRIIDYTH